MTPKLWAFQDEDITRLEPHRAALILWSMGTGKTFGGIERDRRIREARQPELYLRGLPTLIVAPLSTHEQWYDWLYRVHSLPTVVLFSENRNAALARLEAKKPGFYIVHWELLRSNNSKYWATRELYPALTSTKFLHVIADEVHRASNRRAQQTKVLKKINKDSRDPKGFFGYRTGMTGTLITNKPPGAWSILQWLYPKDWTSYWNFMDRYAIVRQVVRGQSTYPEYIGPKNVEELQAKVAPYTVIRKKVDVLPELPDRYYTTIRVDLDPKQRRAYDSMRRNMVAWIGANEQSPLVATATVAKLQRLQQLAISHATIAEDDSIELSEPSSKLDSVMQILEDNPEEQFVVFTQFRGAVHLLATRLTNKGISHSMFLGGLKSDQKQGAIDRFISGEARVFIATIRAGGEGIDGLQCASNAIFIDRDWSPFTNDQAESRLHRAGQINSVHVIDIKARDSVDQLKFSTLARKETWAQLVLDGLK